MDARKIILTTIEHDIDDLYRQLAVLHRKLDNAINGPLRLRLRSEVLELQRHLTIRRGQRRAAKGENYLMKLNKAQKSATIADLLSWRPCARYSAERIHALAAGRETFTAYDILTHPAIGAPDKLWVVLRPELLDELTMRLFACDCAEAVLPIFKRTYPDDHRPQNAIAAAIAAARDATWAAVRDAAAAAAWDAVRDAARSTAGAAADVAAWAAARAATWDDARASTWDTSWDAAGAAARDAADAAARCTAWDAASDAARHAAWSAAWDAAWDAAWENQVKMLLTQIAKEAYSIVPVRCEEG